MTQRTFHATLQLTLESPLLVGGHTSPASYVDATSAKRADYVIPASALRGALREACTRLENAATDGATAETAVGPLTCELFGAPGADRPKLTEGTGDDIAIHSGDAGGTSGKLRVGDAVARDTMHAAVRHGVGVDRWTGAARPEVHFQREVAGGPGDVLSAPLECRASEPAIDLLKRAIALVTGVGNSQSRGLGAVCASIEATTAPIPKRSVELRSNRTELAVRIVAREPLLLGGLPTPTNVRESLPFVSGAVLRGAIANAALRSGIAETYEDFRAALVDPQTCILFSDALPATESERNLPLPAPRSRLACKHAGDRDHRNVNGVARDTLVSGWLAGLLLREGGTVAPFVCPVCSRTLTSAKGWVGGVDPDRRVVTRLGRDVATGAASPGLLYSTVQIEPTATFVGTVARLGDAARRLLARIDAPVRVGGLRNRGLGTVEVTFEESSHLGRGAVQSRRAKLAKAAKPLLDVARVLGVAEVADADRLLAVVARTDVALPPEAAPERVGRALFGEVPFRVLAVAQAAGVRSGWCERTPGPRALRPVVSAGSAWLFAAEGEAPSDEYLARLEVEGVGDDRELGLGRLAIAPHALMEGWE
ncbi:MAG: hypothetical protein KF729_31105 [Sandaracinaceae bacterium]|nr:hypothetical protein [Sandaracinaceae bacterium]